MSTNFPDYVTNQRGRIIFRFLSNLADHFKRNHFWIKGQYGLYAKKFRNVPESYLKQAFQDYLINELEWLPTIKQIVHYMTTQRSDFKTHWHTIPVNQTYCQHCRTDDEGKEGGFREIYFYGFRQSLQKKSEAHYKGACDCELASKSPHAPYTEIVDWMRKQDNFAEIHVSFYDANTDRIVPAQEQSHHHWQKKIDDGIICLDEDGQIAPCWDHPIYTSVFGQWTCDRYGFKMPQHIKDEYNNTRARLRGEKMGKRITKDRRLKAKLDDHGINYVPPQSLGEAMGIHRKN